MTRQDSLELWLANALIDHTFTLTLAAGDASFRRYWRATLEDGSTRIVMDAPPEHEDCAPFVRIAALLEEAGVNVPTILDQDLALGFLLLEDFGDVTYLNAFAAFDGFIPFNTPALDIVRQLLGDATDSLIALQRLPNAADALPAYDAELLTREMRLFPEWLAERHLGQPFTAEQWAVWQQGEQILLNNILKQGQVAVHRDFTVRNLMVTPDHNPGVIDFQDAVYGPISYDILSLTRDAFIGMHDELVLDTVVRYWEKARDAGLPVPESIDEFWRDFEWMGVQRHLKVAGIFARLHYRDGKTKYLTEIPRFLDYIRKTCNRYEELRPLGTLVRDLSGIQEETSYTF